MILAGLVAGGIGTRMKSALPKQFLKIGGEPILRRCLRTFCHVKEIDGILIGVPAVWIPETKEIVASLSASERCEKQIVICEGGSCRNETLKKMMENAEKELGAGTEDIFLTHDAVRPFVTEEIILSNLHAMDNAKACSTAIPATDTVLISMDGEKVYTVPKRSTMFMAQTPQTVRFGEFKEILNSFSEKELSAYTDVCGIYAVKGIAVALVPGSSRNIKITNPVDLVMGEAILHADEE